MTDHTSELQPVVHLRQERDETIDEHNSVHVGDHQVRHRRAVIRVEMKSRQPFVYEMMPAGEGQRVRTSESELLVLVGEVDK